MADQTGFAESAAAAHCALPSASAASRTPRAAGEAGFRSTGEWRGNSEKRIANGFVERCKRTIGCRDRRASESSAAVIRSRAHRRRLEQPIPIPCKSRVLDKITSLSRSDDPQRSPDRRHRRDLVRAAHPSRSSFRLFKPQRTIALPSLTFDSSANPCH
jgi:hypothetical protein